MKIKRILILIFAIFILFGAVFAEDYKGDIQSVIYTFEIDENTINGFCFILTKGNEDINFTSKWDYDVLENNNKKDGVIILKLSGNVSNHEVEIPLLKFPYRVKKTLIVVNIKNKKEKLIWKTGSDFYSIGKDDRVLVESGLEMSEVYILDNKLKKLLQRITELHYNYDGKNENKIYLKEIKTNEEVIVRAWVGKDYEHYIPYVIGTIILCIILLCVFYFVSKKLY